MEKRIKTKIILQEDAERLGIRREQSPFIFLASGKKGKKAHTIERHNQETGEKQFLLKNGKKNRKT